LAQTYLNVYNISSQLVLQNGDVTFDSVRIIYGNCGFVAGTSQIMIWQAGDYHLICNLFHLEPLQMGTFLNGSPIPGTVIGEQNSQSFANTAQIITIRLTDITTPTSLAPSGFAAALTLRNYISYPPGGVHIDGQTGSGTIPGQANINFTVFLLRAS